MTLLLCDMIINVMFWKMGGATTKRGEQRMYELWHMLPAVGGILPVFPSLLQGLETESRCAFIFLHRPNVRCQLLLWVLWLINETVVETSQDLHYFLTLDKFLHK